MPVHAHNTLTYLMTLKQELPLFQYFPDYQRRFSIIRKVFNWRTATKARMILMFTCIAMGEFNIPESITRPCSVKAEGNLRLPPQLEVTKKLRTNITIFTTTTSDEQYFLNEKVVGDLSVYRECLIQINALSIVYLR